MNELHPHPWLTTYRQYSSCLIEINLIPDCAAPHPWFSLTPSLIGLHTISDWAKTQSELSYKYIPFLIGLHTISDWATTQSNLSCMYNCTSHSAYYTISDWATTQSKLSYMYTLYIPFLIGLHTISDWATTQSKLSYMYIPFLIGLHTISDWATTQSKLIYMFNCTMYIPFCMLCYFRLSYNPIKTELHVHPIPDWATYLYYLWLSYNSIKIELHPILTEPQPNQNWAATQSKMSCNPIKIELNLT